MGYKSNVKELEALKKAAPKENREMIQTLIELYRDRKIPNFRTVENAVNRLSLKVKNKSIQAKALKDYEALTKKYKEALPATGRIERSIAEKRLRTGGKLTSITLILFRRAAAGDAEATVNVLGDGKALKNKTRAQGKRILERVKDKSARHARKYGDLEQFYIGSFDLRVDGVEEAFLKSVQNKMLRRSGTVPTPEGGDFKRLAAILKSKNIVFAHLMGTTGDSYLEAMYVMNLADSNFEQSKRLEFDPKRIKNKSGSQVAAYYRYSTTELDLTVDTFKEAIAKTHYVKNECFLNSIYDFYKDNLLSTAKQRNVITRASLLETIGKTEEEVKQGLSIEDVMPFFVKYRLQLRVFDKFYKVVHKYDPPNRNHHNKAMFCLVTDGHVYTLNHMRSRLEQFDDD